MQGRSLLLPARALTLVLATIGLAHAATTSSCPAIGAIRWDAWFGDKGVPGQAVQKSLAPARWHARLPACATSLAADNVRIACDSPDEMKTEIDQAKRAGIAYWAFDVYSESDPMNAGLRTYLASPSKAQIGFAILSEMDKWGNRTTYRPVIERYAQLMKEPSYQKTDDGRPVFFLAFVSDSGLDSRFGGRAAFAAIVDEFKSLVRAAGQKDPYIVLLEGNVDKAKGLIHDLKLDADSAYAVSDNNVKNGTYKQLADTTSAFWSRSAGAGLAVVPPVMTGWDRRPRVMNPVPWEKAPASNEEIDHFYAAPKPAELQAHLAAALRFAQRPAPAGTFKSVLVYAWNEFDEGGWLAPTQGDGTTRLDAVRQALSDVCPGR